ncbi:MAG: hypothetical protein CVV42_17550 [Candidatus Riflebacteria bacterium HGW-Riflebacteria-2]|jgi:hypothetical protein|nr:MAG: hypothetical protein CVV42_17550 [Candidatus Riflebacteria bacterium HGW-Riflebacteria-2]
MMIELYKLCSDTSTAETLTILFFGLIFLGVTIYKHDIIQRLNLKPTGFDKGIIYVSAGITLFCGILLFGKLLFPDNVDSLLKALGLSDFVKSAAFTLQSAVLSILGLFI